MDIDYLIGINKKFGNGHLINRSSLEFALSARSKKIFGNLPYLLRALLIDHAFEDGNKRTAAYLLIEYCETYELTIEKERIIKTIRFIAGSNITDIEKIRSAIKYAVR